MNRYTQSFVLLVLCLAVAGAIGWYATRDPSGTRGWNNESVAVGYIEPTAPPKPQKQLCKTVDQQYVATWEKYRNTVYGYNYQYPKDASFTPHYGDLTPAKDPKYADGEFSLMIHYENEECQDNVSVTIRPMKSSKIDLSLCGVRLESDHGWHQPERIALDGGSPYCYLLRGEENVLAIRINMTTGRGSTPLEEYFISKMFIDDSIGRIYNGWAVKSGSMEEDCSKVVAEGEKKFRGWYVKAVDYVGEPEWLFRIDDRDVIKLPTGFNTPSSRKEGYVVDLGDIDEAAEQKRLNTGPKNPITLTLREWRSYCEGAPGMSVKPSGTK